MIWSDSRGHCSCQGAQCHVEMEGREGRRGGGLWLFLSLAPVCSAQAFIPAHTHTHMHTHTHTHTHTYIHTHARAHARLIHTLGPTSKCRHALVHPPQHTHASHARKQKRGQFREHSCTHTCTHTYTRCPTLAHCSCNEAWRKWHDILLFPVFKFGGNVFFFSSPQWTYWFFPLNYLETFAYCISSSGPVPIEMNCFLWVLGEIWKTTICFVSANSCMPFPC